MPFFLAISRALVLMVVFPVAVYATCNLFLPPRAVAFPGVGEISLRHVLAGAAFILGVLIWTQRPTGRERDEDFSDEAGDGSE
ncbi:MAG: hypothetical protein U1E87_04580 [Alphaproteobacteria bacterium]